MGERIFLLVTVLAASMLLTGLIRFWALRRGLLDIPNQRSSHTVPTPSSGGLAIVTAFVCSIYYLHFTGKLADDRFALLLAATALPLAAVGMWDDVRPLPARYRFSVQLAAALALVWWGGRGAGAVSLLRSIPLPFTLLAVILVLVVVWGVNLFNFMDGIDGLAASEGAFVAGGAAWLLALAGGYAEIIPLFCLVAACFGFLAWNWPPARIFMGDVGSGFLGFVLAGMALRTSVFQPQLPLACWLILPGVFVADATVTLMRRLLRGAKWYAAHRSHAYQHAAARYGSHLKVTAAVLAINFLWLLPLSYLCVILPRFGVVLTFVAYLPLVALALKFGAGRESRP